MLNGENLFKKFKQKGEKPVIAVNDTSVSFDKTGLVCILGESGSGKTTLMNLLGGLDTFNKGTLIFEGKKIKKYNSKFFQKLRVQKFGYIFQDYLLIDDLSVEENIRIGLSLFDMNEEEKKNRIENILKRFGIIRYRNQKAGELSGGQKQRVAIARALVKSPDVIFADEPTGNLDAENTEKVMELLSELSKEQLIIMVTHEKSVANDYADRIIKIRKGEIVEDINNTPAEKEKRKRQKNIILKECKLEKYNVSDIEINEYFETEEDRAEEKIKLDIIWKNKKCYLKFSNDSDNVMFQTNGKIRVYEEKKEQHTKYEPLKKLDSKVKKTSIKDILSLTENLFNGYGSKKVMLKIMLCINSVMLVALAVYWHQMAEPDLSGIVTNDFRCIKIDKDKKLESYDEDNYNELIAKNVLKMVEKTKGMEIIPVANIKMSTSKRMYSAMTVSFTGNRFDQLLDQSSSIVDFQVMPKHLLKKDDMICGKLTGKTNEIVIDKWLANEMIKSDNMVFQSYRKYEDFIGKYVDINGSEKNVVISGVSDTGEPDFYMDKYLMLALTKSSELVSYGDTNLRESLIYDISKNEDVHKKYDNDKKLWEKYLTVMPSYFIYCENTDEITDVLKPLQEKLKKGGCILKYENIARLQKQNYEFTYKSQFERVFVVTLFLSVLTLIMVYYYLRLNADKKKNNIIIFELNGIGKTRFVLAYICEIYKVLLGTVLPFIIVAFFLLKGYANLSLSEFDFNLPIKYILVLLVLIFSIYGLLSLIVILTVTKKTIACQRQN